MKEFFTLDDFDLAGKHVLVRVDINSPMDPETGKILDDTRMRRIMDTLTELNDAKVVILAHQSRPGKKDFKPLKEHAEHLSYLLRKDVWYIDELFSKRVTDVIQSMKDGDILLLENTRFYSEEVSLKGKPIEVHEKTQIVQNLAPLFDYYVNDAFAAAHRAQTTLVGFSRKLPSIAGRLMEKEIVGLERALHGRKPSIAVLGGAKFDDSIDIAMNMLENGIADKVLTTGAVANMFLYASGVKLGEPSERFLIDNGGDEKLVKKAREILEKFPENLVLPEDLAIDYNGERKEVRIDELPTEHPILDIGLETIVKYTEEIKSANTIILNGPAGMFERDEFSLGTTEIFRAVAESRGYSVIGGGHSVATIYQLGIENKIGHISTGGGACINFLAGREMPVIEALKESKRIFKSEK
jgi:phosphoglycerate kinase